MITLSECLTYHDANVAKCPCTCGYIKSKCMVPNAGCKPSTTKNDLDNGNQNQNQQTQPGQTQAVTQAATTAGMGMGGGLMCFSGDTQITTNKGQITLEELARSPQKDVEVLAWDRIQKRAVFSPLKFWIHADPSVKAEYIEITTASGRQLSISDNHVIYRPIDCELDRLEAVFASKIAPGQCLYVQGGSQVEKVATVTSVRKVGIYAPITEEGSIIVNGIAASCYANNENEDIQRFIYTYLWTAADCLQTILPSSWMSQWFGVDGDGPVHGSIPTVLSGFDSLQKSFIDK